MYLISLHVSVDDKLIKLSELLCFPWNKLVFPVLPEWRKPNLNGRFLYQYESLFPDVFLRVFGGTDKLLPGISMKSLHTTIIDACANGLQSRSGF